MINERISAELLEALCRIDSRTADGAAGNIRVAELLAGALRPMGFDIEWVDPAPEEKPRGRHLKAVRNRDASTRVVLIGHTDTVLSPVDVPFRLDHGSGRAYGSGVCDMKGGCVILLDAVRTALAQNAAVRDAGLVVLLDCAEEIAGSSFPELLRRESRSAGACLNFEPSRPGPDGEHELVVGRKGILSFQLTCRGRSAHAGNDHAAGVNAIRELARQVEHIEALTDYASGLTANVGWIRGGHASNQVADEATASFELRAFEQNLMNRGAEAVRKSCAQPTVRSAADGTPATLELTEFMSYPPWSPNAGTETLAQRYVELARRRGIVAVRAKRGGGADACHVAELAPTLDGLGILGGNMHTPDEWADVATLAIRAQIASDLIISVCTDPPGRP